MSGGGRLHASFFNRCNCCILLEQSVAQLSSLRQTFPSREARTLGKHVDTTGCMSRPHWWCNPSLRPNAEGICACTTSVASSYGLLNVTKQKYVGSLCGENDTFIRGTSPNPRRDLPRSFASASHKGRRRPCHLHPRHTRIFMLWWCIDPWHLMDIQCQTVPRAYDVSRVGRNSANVQVHATV